MKKKKIFISFGIILLIFIGIILIWWYYPITRIDTDQLILKDPSIAVHCLTDSKHQLRSTGIQLVSTKINQQLSGLKKTLVQFAIKKVFPEEIRFIANQNPETKQEIRVIVVDFGPGIKLMHLAKQAITQQLLSSSQIQNKDAGQYTIYYISQTGKQTGTKPQACAWIDSGLIMSNDPNLLTELVSKYRAGLVKEKLANQPEGVFSLSNKQHELSDRIRTQEKKLKHAIFPTIDWIDHVEGTLTMQDADKGTGQVYFYTTVSVPKEQQAQIEANIAFFKDELRKQVRAQGFDLTATIAMQENKIEMDYQISGLSHIRI